MTSSWAKRSPTAFSPDGMRVAISHHDGSVEVSWYRDDKLVLARRFQSDTLALLWVDPAPETGDATLERILDADQLGVEEPLEWDASKLVIASHKARPTS